MSRTDITNWLQRQDDEIIGYSPWDEPPPLPAPLRCWDLGDRAITPAAWQELRAFFVAHEGQSKSFLLAELPPTFRDLVAESELSCRARFDVVPAPWGLESEAMVHLRSVRLVEVQQPAAPVHWPSGSPDIRRCRMLVNGAELEGVIDGVTGVVTLDTPPSEPYTGCVVWVDTAVPGDES